MKNYYLSVIVFFLFITGKSYSQCDHDVRGGVTLIIQAGQVGCMTDDFFGSVIVRPGGTLRMCGSYEMAGDQLSHQTPSLCWQGSYI